MKKILLLIGSILFCESVGLLATPFTLAAIPTWYAELNKPPFSPPNWIFGPVWTMLYLLMGIALYLVVKKGLKKPKVQIALWFFIAQLFVNFLWSFLFFGLKSPILGFVDILLMEVLIIATMVKFYSLSKTAFSLFIPYLLWVSFATILNLSILLLN